MEEDFLLKKNKRSILLNYNTTILQYLNMHRWKLQVFFFFLWAEKEKTQKTKQQKEVKNPKAKHPKPAQPRNKPQKYLYSRCQKLIFTVHVTFGVGFAVHSEHTFQKLRFYYQESFK